MRSPPCRLAASLAELEGPAWARHGCGDGPPAGGDDAQVTTRAGADWPGDRRGQDMAGLISSAPCPGRCPQRSDRTSQHPAPAKRATRNLSESSRLIEWR
jgi:hypothetical protein